MEHAWNYIQSEVTNIQTEMDTTFIDQRDLLLNPITKAGFEDDNKLSPTSVTKRITMELELTRRSYLEFQIGNTDTYNINSRECLSYLQSDNLSVQFVTALPDILGIMQDNIFLEAIHQYLGQPSPSMLPYTNKTYYIGRRGRHQVVGEYDDAVARAQIKGGHFFYAHNQLETIFKKILMKVGLNIQMQPLNIFHGKIPNEAANMYNNLHEKDAIIPDIIAYNFPIGTNSNNFKGEAIFDVKTLRIDKSGQLYTQRDRMTTKAVENKFNTVKRNYIRRAEVLDTTCNPDISTQLFTNAMKNNFAKGGIIPLVFGAFGETDKHTLKLIKQCARLVAAKADNAEIAPLVENNTRGSIHQIMLSQFKRALGIMSVRTNAEGKIRRTRFIKDTIVEADAAAKTDNSYFNFKRSHNWYENERNEELFQEFYAYHSHQND